MKSLMKEEFLGQWRTQGIVTCGRPRGSKKLSEKIKDDADEERPKVVPEEIEKKIKSRWMHVQMCMHGRRRNTWTSLFHDGKVHLLNLSIVCDGKHTHSSWGALRKPGGGFATVEE